MKDDKQWLIDQLLDYKERLETLELKMNHVHARLDSMKAYNKMLYHLIIEKIEPEGADE